MAAAPDSPSTSIDHKRKLDDADSDFQSVEATQVEHDVSVSEKRPRLHETLDASGIENGNPPAESDVQETLLTGNGIQNQSVDEPKTGNDGQQAASVEDVSVATAKEEEEKEEKEEKEEEESKESHYEIAEREVDATDATTSCKIQIPTTKVGIFIDKSGDTDNVQESKESNYESAEKEVDATDTTSRKIQIPTSKVGILIGKGGDTVRFLQYNSGAKIQVAKDAGGDLDSLTRPVVIIGTLTSVEKAEKLIHSVLEEADAGGTPSLVARGLPTMQAAEGAEHIDVQVPTDKVGLIIGRGGETIKNMQTRSGARIQLIPQHVPEGDESKERTLRVSGYKKQIQRAREMIYDVINQSVRPSPLSSGYNQPTYRPRGPSSPAQWSSRGPYPVQPMAYDYRHRGPYSSQNSQHRPPSFGGYHSQNMPPRSAFGTGWEQRPPNMQVPPSHGTGYDYYGRQGGIATGPSPPSAVGAPPTQANYNSGQAHAPDYRDAPLPYSQTAPHQNYGPKYDSHVPMQQLHGGHGGSQPGYAPQQHHGMPPSHGMQGQTYQAYGPPRSSQPGSTPYQGSLPSTQSYGPNAAAQQQYGYASSGSMQQGYPPYSSLAPADGYSQPPAAAGPGYQQQGGEQAAAYGQVGATSGYGSYPHSSQQGYAEQPAQNGASYNYQAPQDPVYGSGAGAGYAAAPSGQPGYMQATQVQPGYDQPAPPSAAGYGGGQASAPVGYGAPL